MLGLGWIRRRVAIALAGELLAGAWNRRALLRRAGRLLGGRAKKSRGRLVADIMASISEAYPPSPDRLVDLILASDNFEAASAHAATSWRDLPVIPRSPNFAPAERFVGLFIPKLSTEGDLAAWLDITVAHLEWFADQRRQQGRTAHPILQHYDYIFVPKASGPPRLIEAPKSRLKAMQRRILCEILGVVPVHPDAHGFVRDRSCLTAAQLHAGEAVLVTLDLKDFFPSTPTKRVHGLFRSLGYPWAVARALTSLCSTQTPATVFLRLPKARRPDWTSRRLFQTPHLAQGAPTSPALANLAAFNLDLRLNGLAQRYGATYTRYADDLAFSGDEGFSRRSDRLCSAVAAIASDEGYRLNLAKTRVMQRGDCQRLTGIVVNDHVNVSRPAFDALKAILHNCRKNGPDLENRSGHANFRAHLDGRVSWVEQVNPQRGAKLRQVFDGISWPPPPTPQTPA